MAISKYQRMSTIARINSHGHVHTNTPNMTDKISEILQLAENNHRISSLRDQTPGRTPRTDTIPNENPRAKSIQFTESVKTLNLASRANTCTTSPFEIYATTKRFTSETRSHRMRTLNRRMCWSSLLTSRTSCAAVRPNMLLRSQLRQHQKCQHSAQMGFKLEI